MTVQQLQLILIIILAIVAVILAWKAFYPQATEKEPAVYHASIIKLMALYNKALVNQKAIVASEQQKLDAAVAAYQSLSIPSLPSAQASVPSAVINLHSTTTG